MKIIPTLDLINRILILFCIAGFITSILCIHIRGLSMAVNRIESVDIEKGEYIESLPTKYDLSKNISDLIKTPTSILYFDLYFQNFRKYRVTETGEEIESTMNLEINNYYKKYGIEFGKEEKVIPSRRLSDFKNLIVTRSFPPKNNIPLVNTTPVVGSYYVSYMSPTWKSVTFLYFVVGMPLSYAILVFINACYGFIRFGKPFTSKE